MSTHTPGPWSHNFFRDANDGYPVRNVLAPNGCTLALIQHTAEDAANVRLMAAAPDLLAALRIAKQFVSIASDWNIDEAEIDGEMRSTYDALDNIRTAIAKATEAA